MVNYSQSVIYKIQSVDNKINNIYVGSTTCFRKRKYCHKSRVKTNKTIKLYKFIRENGGWLNFNMIWLANASCNSKKQLNSIEGTYIRNTNASLNTYMAGRNCNEAYKLKYSADYRSKHKDKSKKYNKMYYAKNKAICNVKKSCEHCARLVYKRNLKSHYRSKRCTKIKLENEKKREIIQ